MHAKNFKFGMEVALVYCRIEVAEMVAVQIQSNQAILWLEFCCFVGFRKE